MEKNLVRHIFSYYKDKGTTMLVGTGDIPDYLFLRTLRICFSHRLEKIIFRPLRYNFMFEDGIQLKDKVYLKMDLGAV